jgi:hypothetical protein
MDYELYRLLQAERCLQYADWVTADEQKQFWRKCAEDWLKKTSADPLAKEDMIGRRSPDPD